ncbi:MAG: hypothetical protein FVQ84_20885 [Planctomycetes bacterium]|nr:hypothetical protein [Planctomycetota bacterium]
MQHLEEVNSSLQVYLESVVKGVSPEESETIISEQQKRLDFSRKMYDLKGNHLYAFLSSEIDLSLDAIIKLISKSDNAYKLADVVYEVTNRKSDKERIERMVQRFPRLLNDFDKLKKEMET